MARTATKKSTAETMATATEVKSTDVKEKAPKPVPVKEIDIHQYVTVRNGFQGKLIYKSRHTGEKFVWEEFGEEQEMELVELKNAKSASKDFFARNWFMFDDEWIIDYLGVRQFYKDSIGIDEFDGLFDKTPAQITKILEKMPEGQKRSVLYLARQKIADGEIDSNKVIDALEKALGVELRER